MLNNQVNPEVSPLFRLVLTVWAVERDWFHAVLVVDVTLHVTAVPSPVGTVLALEASVTVHEQSHPAPVFGLS